MVENGENLKNRILEKNRKTHGFLFCKKSLILGRILDMEYMGYGRKNTKMPNFTYSIRAISNNSKSFSGLIFVHSVQFGVLSKIFLKTDYTKYSVEPNIAKIG